MKHLFDAKTGRPKRSQPFHVLVLRENLHNLLAVLVWIAIEAVNCVCRAWGNTTCSGRACNGSQGANVYAISGVTECRVIVPKFRPPTVTLLF
jgi:hypothetical protein